MRNPNILVLGHSQHGKDLFTEYLIKHSRIPLLFQSSSMFCINLFIFDHLKAKYKYKTSEDCFNDRHNHRAELHRLIQEYNSPDKSKLATEIFKSYDIYVGQRSNEEFQACLKKELFDLIFWVDRSNHEPFEGKGSFDITFDPRIMIHVDNNGTKEELEKHAWVLGRSISKVPEFVTH